MLADTSSATIHYHRVPENWRKTEKLAFLREQTSLSKVEWQTLVTDGKSNWLTKGMSGDFEAFVPIGSKVGKAAKSSSDEPETIFKTYSLGISTNRDDVVYDFDRAKLIKRVKQFIEDYNGEVFRWQRAGKPRNIDDFVRYKDIQWSSQLKSRLKSESFLNFTPEEICVSLYRPFCKTFHYYEKYLNDRPALQKQIFPTIEAQTENLSICLTDLGSEKPFMVLISNHIADLHLVGAGASSQCFPFYIYDENGSNRRENITDWALEEFRGQMTEASDAAVTRRDLFHYVYALLHVPAYRAKYAENLKRELPRLPMPKDLGELVGPRDTSLRRIIAIGAELAELHLGYEQAQPYPLQEVVNTAAPFSWRVERMKLTPDKQALVVNPTLTLTGIPPEVFAYRLGNRSAVDWVIDQYQVSTDSRSGIVTDPNNADDEEYIVRLVKQVTTVSVETMRRVNELAELLPSL